MRHWFDNGYDYKILNTSLHILMKCHLFLLKCNFLKVIYTSSQAATFSCPFIKLSFILSWGMTASWHLSIKWSYKETYFVPSVLQKKSWVFFLNHWFKDLMVNLRSSRFFCSIKRPFQTSKIILMSRTGFWPDETRIIDIAKGLGQTAVLLCNTLDLLRSSLPVRPKTLLATKQFRTCASMSHSKLFWWTPLCEVYTPLSLFHFPMKNTSLFLIIKSLEILDEISVVFLKSCLNFTQHAQYKNQQSSFWESGINQKIGSFSQSSEDVFMGI